MESEWHRQVRSEIINYFEDKNFDTRTSHEKRGKLPLYFKEVKRSTFTSDVDIVALKDDQVRYIVEVQGSIRPKDIIGIIGAIDISTIYADKNTQYPLKDVTLVIVTKPYIKGSKKGEQIKTIKDGLRGRFKLTGGCLKDFMICKETDFRKVIA